MNSRFDFDETPLKKDFGSFSLEDISSGSSLTSIIKSIFTPGSRLTWNDVYKFAYNKNSTYCAILIGQQLFRVSISDGRQIFTNVGENYYDVAYLSERDEIIILSDKQITYYNSKLASIKSIPNNKKIIRLAIINDDLVGITKSQIIFIEETEINPIEIEEWTHLSYCNKLICLGSKTISIINDDYNTIHPNIKCESIKEISCNSKGTKIYILDNKNQITILSEKSNFMKPTINSTTGTIQIMPWKDDFYLTLNNYNTISFFNNNGQRALSKNIKPNSVLRYVPSGFLMFDPQNVIGQNVHFDIVKFTPVDPYDLYTRSCENSMWSEAKKLQEIYNFDADIFHKYYIQNNELNRRIIDEHLRLIKDKDYVYNFVLNNSSISSDIESALINEGLRVRPNDEKLTKIRERLRIFTKLPRTSFLQSEWNEFKNSDMQVILQNFSKNQKFKDIAIIFQESKEVTKSDKDNIITHLSPFIPPSEYECLMPDDVDYFMKKCFEIDDRIGQTDILCQFLKIGSTRFPDTLSELYNNSLLFDEFVCNATNLEAVKKMSFSDFINLSDEQKLFIFISESSNGLEARKIIEKYCLKICQNSFDGLCTLMSNILSDSPEMFKKSPEPERIKFVSQIIDIFPSKSALADQILSNSTIILDDQNISAILLSFSYLSESTKDLLTLLRFNNRNAKPKSFKLVTDKTIPEFILSVGEYLLTSKNLTFDNWSEFTKTSKRVYKDHKKDTEFKNRLKMETFNAMLTLKEWSEIEITNSREIDICLDFCQKMIKSAKSCSLRDENLSSAVQILGMIPDDMQPPIVKSLFNRFMMYDAFSELDNLITPSIIDTTEDKTILILNILERKSDSKNLREDYVKVKSIYKKLNDINIVLLNDYFAKKAIENGDINFGVDLINDGFVNISEKTMVLYLLNEKWYDIKKKETIVDDCIKNCSPKNIDKFIDCKEKLTKTADVNDMSLLKFIIDSDNPDACNFAKSKLSQPIVEVITKCILSNLQNISFFETTVSTLLSKKMIVEKDQKELKSRMISAISRCKSNKEIFNAIDILSEKIEFPKAIVDKYCCGYVSSNNSNFSDESTLNCIELIRKWSELKLEFNLLISMMKQLRKDKLLRQEIALEIALSSFNMKNDSLRTDAKLWSDILDEQNELKLLEKTGDFGFGLASSKPNVVLKAKQMMNDDGELPQGAIQQIIERKEVHMFVGTPRFNQIVKSIKSPKQLKNVIFCLKENGNKKEIATIATDYFGLPDALSQNVDDVLDLTYQLLK